ncbi:MAG: hypothetical protein ACF8Q5_02610 [Phycisphaerales bacterium JB040]
MRIRTFSFAGLCTLVCGFAAGVATAGGGATPGGSNWCAETSNCGHTNCHSQNPCECIDESGIWTCIATL